MVRPAAFCGVVGFRGTCGRVPLDGVVPNSSTLDAVGIFTSDVASARLAAPELWTGWRYGVGPERPVLGVPAGAYLDLVTPEARASFDAALHRLRAEGFDVLDVPLLQDIEQLREEARVIHQYELAAFHRDWFAEFGHLYDERTADQVRVGQGTRGDRRQVALDRRARFIGSLLGTMEMTGVDVWVTPAALGTAPQGLDSTGDPVMAVPWSLAGWPALSLPAGAAPNGLPLGLQCVARGGADEELLTWAAQLQNALAGDGDRG